MPELPEVEVVRRGIQRWAAGRTISSVTVHDPRSLRRFPDGADAFTQLLSGRTLGSPQRRGKYLWIPLAGEDYALMIHLGMSGQVLMEDSSASAEKHLKITLQLESDTTWETYAADDVDAVGTQQQVPDQLRFVDQRIFGGMQLSPLIPTAGPLQHDSGTVPEAAAHIAADPLEPVVTAETFFRALRNRRSGLKRALLDQTLISGVGNIYADEALWRATLHYARRTETITRAQAQLLLSSIQDVMAAALEAGGTSFDSLYVNVNGASGYFDRSLQCYAQAGKPCSRCGEIIRRDKFMGRSSYWCPRCQPRPRTGRW